MDENIARIRERLISQHGYSEGTANLLTSVMIHETGWGKHVAAPNNYGGLSTSNWTPYARPANEGGYYQAFDSPEEFTDEWVNQVWRHYSRVHEITDPTEFAYYMKANGYYDDSPEKYAHSLVGIMNDLTNGDYQYDPSKVNAFDDTDGDANWQAFNNSYHTGLGDINSMYDDSFFYPYGKNGRGERYHINRPSNSETGFWDSFLNQWFDNGTVSLARSAFYDTNIFRRPFNDTAERDAQGNLVYSTELLKQAQDTLGITQEELKTQQGRRYEALEWAKGWANDQQHFMNLVKMKAEDIAREERLENSDTTISNYFGAAAGMLLDPLNFVPVVGQEAFALKLLGKAGSKMAAKLSEKTVARISELALTNGLINVGDQHISNIAGGHNNQNYVSSFLMGAGALAGLETFRHLRAQKAIRLGKEAERTELLAEKLAHETSLRMSDVKVAHYAKSKERQVPTSMQQAFSDRGITSIRKLHEVMDVEPAFKNELKKEIKVKYGGSIPLESNSDYSKYLKVAGDTIEWRSDKWVDTMNRVGAKSEAELASYALGMRKTKRAEEIQQLFNEELEADLSHAQFYEVAKHLKETSGELSDIGLIYKDGRVRIHGEVLDSDHIVAQALKDDSAMFTPAGMQFKSDKEDMVDVFAEEKHGHVDGRDYRDNLTTSKEVREENTKHSSKVMKVLAPLTQWLGRNRFFGSRYELLNNSTSNTLRKVAKYLGTDPVQRSTNGKIPAGQIKQILMNRYNRLIGNYYDTYKAYCKEQGLMGAPRKDLAERFNAAVDRYYDAMFNPHSTQEVGEVSEAVKKGAQAVKAFREFDLKMSIGYGVLPEDFRGAGELWRRIDHAKVNTLRTQFKSEAEYRKFMQDYAYRATRWKLIKDSFKDEYIKDADISKAEADLLLDKYCSENPRPAFAKDEDKVTYIKTEILPKNKEAFKRFVSGHWAETALAGELDDVRKFAGNSLGYYQSRIPMNTAMEAQLPNGELFTFNESIRNRDLASHMHYVANRSSGAIALHHVGIDNIGSDLRGIYDRVQGELMQAQNQGLISKSQREHELQALREVLHDISGATLFPEDIEPDGVMDYLKRILLSHSYVRNGLNFGLNQLSEMLGSTSVVGTRALTHYVPALHDFLHDLRYSKHFTSEQLKHFREDYTGLDLAEYVFYNPRTIDIRKLRNANQGYTMQALGMLEDGINQAGKITSSLSRISQLTNIGTSMVKADLVPQIMEYATGNYSSFMRKNLFSKANLQAAGIFDEVNFKNDVRSYLGNLDKSDPKALNKAMRKWEEEAKDTFIQFHAFLDINSQRAIIQPNIWNQASKYKGLAGIAQALVWQFKNFSQMAIGSHIFRALSRQQREDFFQILTTGLGAGLIFALRARVNADMYYKEGDPRKEAFLERNLNPEKVILTGLMRSSILSGFSFATDGYEALTGGFSSRTTVNRMGDTGNPYLNIAMQYPAMASVRDTYNGGVSLYDFTRNITSKDSHLIDPLFKLFPLDRYMPVTAALSAFADDAYLERRRMNRAREMKEAMEKRKKERKEKKQNGKNVQSKGILDYFK